MSVPREPTPEFQKNADLARLPWRVGSPGLENVIYALVGDVEIPVGTMLTAHIAEAAVLGHNNRLGRNPTSRPGSYSLPVPEPPGREPAEEAQRAVKCQEVWCPTFRRWMTPSEHATSVKAVQEDAPGSHPKRGHRYQYS